MLPLKKKEKRKRNSPRKEEKLHLLLLFCLVLAIAVGSSDSEKTESNQNNKGKERMRLSILSKALRSQDRKKLSPPVLLFSAASRSFSQLSSQYQRCVLSFFLDLFSNKLHTKFIIPFIGGSSLVDYLITAAVLPLALPSISTASFF